MRLQQNTLQAGLPARSRAPFFAEKGGPAKFMSSTRIAFPPRKPARFLAAWPPRACLARTSAPTTQRRRCAGGGARGGKDAGGGGLGGCSIPRSPSSARAPQALLPPRETRGCFCEGRLTIWISTFAEVFGGAWSAMVRDHGRRHVPGPTLRFRLRPNVVASSTKVPRTRARHSGIARLRDQLLHAERGDDRRIVFPVPLAGFLRPFLATPKDLEGKDGRDVEAGFTRKFAAPP